PCGESENRARPERRTPTVMDHDVSDKQRRKASTRSHSGKYPSIRDTALADRNPAGNKLIGRGIDDSLARAQKKSHCDEYKYRPRNVCRDQSSQSGEDSPPH